MTTFLGSVATTVGLILLALNDSISYFILPSQVASRSDSADRINTKRVRLGGIVQAGSVVRDGAWVCFRVSDTIASVSVCYHGLLPNLFREDQGVVVEGKIQKDGTLRADRVLAKHDETYKPPEIKELLRQSGLQEAEP